MGIKESTNKSISIEGAIAWMFVSPQIHILKPSPQYDGIRR